ncbi:MAG TPA: endopeptidase La [Pyrinomonadaceae bacterium]|nr:endopeptidase La [Chloracidobacterium sp.]MBP9935081.1 endopeptidase La [Pyrinomonadaceae bacterium]MBK7803494.1 endopeptidase La [Chloracidobacterium sp.]MBK9438741.1 endopeptidase La [Chloracidobacterium sp.]MBL0241268.1 endopeptidase La [Chloracidobacterium sp.]
MADINDEEIIDAAVPPLPQQLEIAVLPLQNTTLFPDTVVPLAVGRERSTRAVESALATEEKLIACVTTKTENVTGDDATPTDLYQIGTVVNIKRMMRNEGVMQLIVQGIDRFEVLEWTGEQPYLKAKIQILPVLRRDDDEEIEALKRNIQGMIQEALALLPNVPPEIRLAVMSQEDPVQLSYFLASVLDLGTETEQKMLESSSVDGLLTLAHAALAREVEIMQIRSKIASEAQQEMDKSQRDYVLRQQMKAIQKELGDDESGEQAEAEQLRERLEKADLPDDVRKEATRELKRMEQLPQSAPDYHVIRTYIEYILELPWRRSSEEKLDLAEARKILDEDHYGLDDIKERILESLAVVKLRPDSKSPIILFVGPPGVGKTSLGRSIARALGREFDRMSLGGMRDEAELRGHRRTYIGAMPGRIIQSLRRVSVNNPVLMLDEIDKLGNDFRGDPASALLEILDPAQNNTFRDNYIDLPFDLSKVFFIATANQLQPIPMPLRDRMEIIHLGGYSDREKLGIARQYLIPRQIKENGLTEDQLEISDDAVNLLTSRYTREAGVRQLERTVGNLARKVALKVAEGLNEKVSITAEEIKGYIGPPRVYPEEARKELPPGVATGMAWTEMGGEVLFIEATLLPGGSGLTLTGQLGDVMKESAQAARSYLWSHAVELGIDPEAIKQNGVHIHVPAGAIPKDGPSAGVTMASALASLYTGRKVRSDTAMTGEITLSGLVFPVGGVKEKVLAAHRAGIRRIILPDRNEVDLEEIPDDVRKELAVFPATRISDVLSAALEKDANDNALTSYTVQNIDTKPDIADPLIAKEN